jgi:uncharacterized membrane protein
MGQMMGGMMGQMMGGGMMGPGWGGLSWFGLLAVGAIVFGGLAIAYAIARRPTASTGEDPNEILRRRFARGELSAEDLGAARKVLG